MRSCLASLLCFTALTLAVGCEREPAPAPEAREAAAPQPPQPAPAPGFQGIHDELRKRFVAAMRAAVQAPVGVWDEGGLTGLVYLEKDFGVLANVDALVAEVLETRPLPRLVRGETAGLAAAKLLENKVDMAWIRANVKVKVAAEVSDTARLIFAAQSAVAACRASEAEYNAKLLAHLDTLAWPRDTEWIRYGMYAGFVMHGCIAEEAARRQTEPLVKPLVAWLGRTPSVDLKAYALFALAASGRLREVPSQSLLEFVRAQRPDGTWRGGPLELSGENQAPLGAYVIAAMLRASGEPLPQTDFRITSQLPVSAVPNPSSPRGKP